jgi:hypothetical protein
MLMLDSSVESEPAMKKAIAAGAALILLVIACVGIYMTWSTGSTAASSTPGATGADLVSTMKTGISSVKTATVNAAIDASGIKAKLNDALMAKAPEIAVKTGASESDVDEAIESLDVSSWQAASLPAGAVSTATYPIDYQGTSASVTTYEDPSYITVDALGQSLTLSVPQSAESSLGYLDFLAS